MSLSATLHLISILVWAVLPLLQYLWTPSLTETHTCKYGVKLSGCIFFFLHGLRTGWGAERGVCGGWWKNGIKLCNVKTDVGLQSCVFWTDFKGRINIWVRCIKQRFSVGVSEGYRLVSKTHKLCTDRNWMSADIPAAEKWTFPNVALCGCKWISTLNLNT